MERVLLIGIVLVSWFLLYRDHVVKKALRESVSNLVNIQEIFISKLDGIAASLHDLPYGFKQSCDVARKELVRDVLRTMTLKSGKLRKELVDQIIKRMDERTK